MSQLSIFPSSFTKYLEDNPHIYPAFEREALRIARRQEAMGKDPHYSARTIVHYLRFKTDVSENGGEFKINNNWSPFLGRLFELRNPEYAGIFKRRKSKADAEIMGV